MYFKNSLRVDSPKRSLDLLLKQSSTVFVAVILHELYSFKNLQFPNLKMTEGHLEKFLQQVLGDSWLVMPFDLLDAEISVG